ncbi:HEAT repeat domain-containing protein [Bradyrhizobium sp. HKCCYLS20291]|uniref:HEAT repeat domain-containing protein n=1 Tax=Bradyrhizobium sp. HKCCYLS20291 TaxID=3420766 RepID=UPI003EC0A304
MVRREAAWTLRANVASLDWLQLFEAFRVDDPPRHRVWACELAGQFGNADVVAQIEPLRSDRDGHVRTAAAAATDALSRRGPHADVRAEMTP